MTKDEIFDSEYSDDSTESSTDDKSSTTKSFLKNPFDEQEIKRYGTSKPYRIITNAKIIKDNNND